VAVDPALTLSDVDSNFMAGATITIANHVAGEDFLNFTDADGITGSFNASTGVLTLSGLASVAAYETALRSITYANGSDNPPAARTIEFTVTDDSGASSPAVSKSIVVTPVNDAPVAPTVPATVTVGGGGVAGIGVSADPGESLVQTFVAGGVNPDTLTLHVLTDPAINPPGTEFEFQIREMNGDVLGSLLWSAGVITGTGVKEIDLTGLELVPGTRYAMVLLSDQPVNVAISSYADGWVAEVLSPGGVFGGGSVPQRSGDIFFAVTYADARITVEEGHDYQLEITDLPYIDADSGPAHISFGTVAGAGHGQFELRVGSTTTVVNGFTYAQVLAGQIFYNHDGNLSPTDSFTLRVFDESLSSADLIDVAVRVTEDTVGFVNETFKFAARLGTTETFSQVVTAGPGIEVAEILGAGNWGSLDFEDEKFVFNYTDTTPGTVAAMRNLLISDVNGELASFTGATLTSVSGITGLEQGDITFDADNIYLDVEGVQLSTGDTFTIDVLFA
jgi:hypothetical protein